MICDSIFCTSECDD